MYRHSAALVACSDEHRLKDLWHQLSADGHDADAARSAGEAAAAARRRAPQLVVLAPLAQPHEQLALLREIRTGEGHGADFNHDVAVVVLGTSGGELELVRSFEAGCDDYLAPSASHLELRARLGGVLRRLRPRGVAPTRIGALTIDAHSQTASYAGQRVALTRMEMALLCHLAADPTRVATKQELLRDVWGYRLPVRTRSVDCHACRLRSKLRAAGARGLVVTVHGVGYRLTDSPILAASAPHHPAVA